MVNMVWISQFLLSKEEFHLPGISDHSPSIVYVFENRIHGPPPFKFFNYFTEEPDFMELVRHAWNSPVRGNPMLILVTKTKTFKKFIINWKKVKFRNISQQVLLAKDKDKMDFVQTHLQSHPLNQDLSRREREYVAEYVKLAKFEEY